METNPRAERFLKACRREPVDMTPAWMMRQAGRSLPAYLEIRRRFGFIEIMKEPELCARVTLMPLDVMEVDAAIMFADIMTPVTALGMEYRLEEGVGPRVPYPIRSSAELDRLTVIPAAEAVPELMQAIKLVRAELEGVVPLIGFAGAPFTLASYLIEGKPTRDFTVTRSLMTGQPGLWHRFMETLAAMITDYLRAQVDAGIQAFQLFDSWVGELSPSEYREYVLPHSRRIFDQTAALGVPRIHFGTRTGPFLEAMAEPGPEVVGVDSLIPLDEAWRRIGYHRAIQGNLDPQVLLTGSPDEIVSAVDSVISAAGGRPGHLFNLGHGILPKTPLKNLQLMVDRVHESSASATRRPE